jgi:hypothetical protein
MRRATARGIYLSASAQSFSIAAAARLTSLT